jgi:transcriptional regulator with XRE-family HTH domain
MQDKHPLRTYRKRANKSLEELAKECGTTRATLSRVETGHQSPSLDLIDRIRTATGGAVRADDFLPFRLNDQDESSPSAARPQAQQAQTAEDLGDAA